MPKRSFSELEEEVERILREISSFPESERRKMLLGELLSLIEEADSICFEGLPDLQ